MFVLNRLVLMVFLMAVTGTLGMAEESCVWHDVEADVQRDRAAILGMAGAYKVGFRFEETVGVASGYELAEPYEAHATELVEVVEDRGDRISLQHILVVKHPETGESRVVKHWRQDWTFEDRELLVYLGNQTWQRFTLPEEEVKGTWTQAVYQVDDSPRYESFGRWVHIGERSSWTSEKTWRPLPRRETTKRRDYDVMEAVNRHTVTPDGWYHEQSNEKVVLGDGGEPVRVIAHETGLNRYERIDGAELAAARAYWDEHRAFWSAVRGAWGETLSAHERLELRRQAEGKFLGQRFAELIESDAEVQAALRDAVAERIRAYVVQ